MVILEIIICKDSQVIMADTVVGYVVCFAWKLNEMDRDRHMHKGRRFKPYGLPVSECTHGFIGMGNLGLKGRC
jgi:phosphoglycerate dehydrogenase-like enzyme